MNKTKSSGATGERMAEYYFRWREWRMTRHQPSTRVIHGKIMYTGGAGIPDYTGYDTLTGKHIECEAKEARGKSMPASRLSAAQRERLLSLPDGMAHVYVFWVDKGVGSIHKPISKGSYKWPE